MNKKIALATLFARCSCKQITAIFSLTAFLATNYFGLPSAQANVVEAIHELPLHSFPSDLSSVSLPNEIGNIQESYKGNGQNVVVLVQDAHAIPDAQRSIQKMIDHFQRQYGLNQIAVEGASSQLDPQIFRSFPDKEILKKTFESYFERGELTGATAAAIFGEESFVGATRRVAPTFCGIENWKLYEEGLGFYLKAMAAEPQILEQIHSLQKDLQKEKEKIYSKQLFEIDEALQKFQENHSDLMKVVQVLKEIGDRHKQNMRACPLFLKALLEESDSPEIEREVKKIAEQVRTSLRATDIYSSSEPPRFHGGESRRKALFSTSSNNKLMLSNFNPKYQAFQTSQISASEFALYLKENFDFVSFSPRLSRLISNQRHLRDIEGTKFFKEFEAYAQSVKESLFRNDEERKLDQQTRQLYLLTKLATLELSREEWEEVKKLTNENVFFDDQAIGQQGNKGQMQSQNPQLGSTRFEPFRSQHLDSIAKLHSSHFPFSGGSFGQSTAPTTDIITSPIPKANLKKGGRSANQAEIRKAPREISTSRNKNLDKESRRYEPSMTLTLIGNQGSVNKNNHIFYDLKLLRSCLAFYENAEKRDGAFFTNLLQLLSAQRSTLHATLFIAGGFHTQGLIQRFKEQGISYVLVMPNIHRMPAKNSYQDLMKGEVSWKNYFRVENGKVNLYDAFVRSARDQLLTKAASFLLKQWRDQIIRDLANQREIENAREYTQYLDELTNGASRRKYDALRSQWLANIDRFIQGLKNLHATGRLTEPNILQLLKPSMTLPAAGGTASLDRLASVSEDIVMNDRRALLSRSEVRVEKTGEGHPLDTVPILGGTDPEAAQVRETLKQLAPIIPASHARLLESIRIEHSLIFSAGKVSIFDVIFRRPRITVGLGRSNKASHEPVFLRDVIVHELGHVVENYLPGAKKIWRQHNRKLFFYSLFTVVPIVMSSLLLLAAMPEWKTFLIFPVPFAFGLLFLKLAMHAPIVRWFYRQNAPFVNDYAMAPYEDFAESYRLYVLDRDDFWRKAQRNLALMEKYTEMEKLFNPRSEVRKDQEKIEAVWKADSPKNKARRLRDLIETSPDILQAIRESKEMLESLDLRPYYQINKAGEALFEFSFRNQFFFARELDRPKRYRFDLPEHKKTISQKEFFDILLHDSETREPVKTIRQIFEENGLGRVVEQGLPLEREMIFYYDKSLERVRTYSRLLDSPLGEIQMEFGKGGELLESGTGYMLGGLLSELPHDSFFSPNRIPLFAMHFHPIEDYYPSSADISTMADQKIPELIVTPSGNSRLWIPRDEKRLQKLTKKHYWTPRLGEVLDIKEIAVQFLYSVRIKGLARSVRGEFGQTPNSQDGPSRHARSEVRSAMPLLLETIKKELLKADEERGGNRSRRFFVEELDQALRAIDAAKVSASESQENLEAIHKPLKAILKGSYEFGHPQDILDNLRFLNVVAFAFWAIDGLIQKQKPDPALELELFRKRIEVPVLRVPNPMGKAVGLEFKEGIEFLKALVQRNAIPAQFSLQFSYPARNSDLRFVNSQFQRNMISDLGYQGRPYWEKFKPEGSHDFFRIEKNGEIFAVLGDVQKINYRLGLTFVSAEDLLSKISRSEVQSSRSELREDWEKVKAQLIQDFGNSYPELKDWLDGIWFEDLYSSDVSGMRSWLVDFLPRLRSKIGETWVNENLRELLVAGIYARSRSFILYGDLLQLKENPRTKWLEDYGKGYLILAAIAQKYRWSLFDHFKRRLNRDGLQWINEKWPDFVRIGKKLANQDQCRAFFWLLDKFPDWLDDQRWKEFIEFAKQENLQPYEAKILTESLPLLRKAFGPSWFKDWWEDLLAFGRIDPQILMGNTFWEMRWKFSGGRRWLKKHRQDLKKMAAWAGKSAGLLFKGLIDLEKKNTSKAGWVNRHWPDILKLVEILGGQAAGVFSDGIPELRKTYGEKWVNDYWPLIFRLAEQAPRDTLVLYYALSYLKPVVANQNPSKIIDTLIQLSREIPNQDAAKLVFEDGFKELVSWIHSENLLTVGRELIRLAGDGKMLWLFSRTLPALKDKMSLENFPQWVTFLSALAQKLEGKEFAADFFVHAIPNLKEKIILKNVSAMGETLIDLADQAEREIPLNPSYPRRGGEWLLGFWLNAVKDQVTPENLKEIGTKTILLGRTGWERWSGDYRIFETNLSGATEVLNRQTNGVQELETQLHSCDWAISILNDAKEKAKIYEAVDHPLITPYLKNMKLQIESLLPALESRRRELLHRLAAQEKKERDYERWKEKMEKMISRIVKHYSRFLEEPRLGAQTTLSVEDAVASISTDGGTGVGIGLGFRLEQRMEQTLTLQSVLGMDDLLSVDENLVAEFESQFDLALPLLIAHELSHLLLKKKKGERFEVQPAGFDAETFSSLEKVSKLRGMADEVVIDRIAYELAVASEIFSGRLDFDESLNPDEKAALSMKALMEIILHYANSERGNGALSEVFVVLCARFQAEIQELAESSKINPSLQNDLRILDSRFQGLIIKNLSGKEEMLAAYAQLVQAYRQLYRETRVVIQPARSEVRTDEERLTKIGEIMEQMPYVPKWLDDPAFSNRPGVTPRQMIDANGEFLSFAESLKPFFSEISKTNLVLRHSITKLGGSPALGDAGFSEAKTIVEKQQFDWQRLNWGSLFASRGAWQGISWGNNSTRSDETVLEMDFKGNLLLIHSGEDKIREKIEEFLKTGLTDIRRSAGSDDFGEGANGVPLFGYLYDVLMRFYDVDAVQYYFEDDVKHLLTEILVKNPASVRNLRIVHSPGFSSGASAEFSRSEARIQKRDFGQTIDGYQKVLARSEVRTGGLSRLDVVKQLFGHVNTHQREVADPFAGRHLLEPDDFGFGQPHRNQFLAGFGKFKFDGLHSLEKIGRVVRIPEAGFVFKVFKFGYPAAFAFHGFLAPFADKFSFGISHVPGRDDANHASPAVSADNKHIAPVIGLAVDQIRSASPFENQASMVTRLFSLFGINPMAGYVIYILLIPFKNTNSQRLLSSLPGSIDVYTRDVKRRRLANRSVRGEFGRTPNSQDGPSRHARSEVRSMADEEENKIPTSRRSEARTIPLNNGLNIQRFFKPKIHVSIETFRQADRILKQRQAAGIVIGSTAGYFWNPASREKDLQQHQDIDIAVLAPSFPLNRDFEGGVDWWIPVERDISLRTNGVERKHRFTLFVNANTIFLRAGISMDSDILQKLSPGLYLPSRHFLADLSFHVALSAAHPNDIQAEEVRIFRDRIDQSLGKSVSSIWTGIFGDQTVLDESSGLRVVPFDHFTVRAIRKQTAYENRTPRSYEEMLAKVMTARPHSRSEVREITREQKKKIKSILWRMMKAVREGKVEDPPDYQNLIAVDEWIWKTLEREVPLPRDAIKRFVKSSGHAAHYYKGILDFVRGRIFYQKYKSHAKDLNKRRQRILELRFDEGRSQNYIFEQLNRENLGVSSVDNIHIIYTDALNRLQRRGDSSIAILAAYRDQWDSLDLPILSLFVPEGGVDIGLTEPEIARKTGHSVTEVRERIENAVKKFQGFSRELPEIFRRPEDRDFVIKHQNYVHYLHSADQRKWLRILYLQDHVPDRFELHKKLRMGLYSWLYLLRLRSLRKLAEISQEGNAVHMIETNRSRLEDALREVFPKAGSKASEIIRKLFPEKGIAPTEIRLAAEEGVGKERIRQLKDIALFRLSRLWKYPLKGLPESLQNPETVEKRFENVCWTEFKEKGSIKSFSAVNKKLKGISDWEKRELFRVFREQWIREYAEDPSKNPAPESQKGNYLNALKDLWQRFQEARHSGRNQSKVSAFMLETVLRESYDGSGKIMLMEELSRDQRIHASSNTSQSLLRDYLPGIYERNRTSPDERDQAFAQALASKKTYAKYLSQGPSARSVLGVRRPAELSTDGPSRHTRSEARVENKILISGRDFQRNGNVKEFLDQLVKPLRIAHLAHQLKEFNSLLTDKDLSNHLYNAIDRFGPEAWFQEIDPIVQSWKRARDFEIVRPEEFWMLIEKARRLPSNSTFSLSVSQLLKSLDAARSAESLRPLMDPINFQTALTGGYVLIYDDNQTLNDHPIQYGESFVVRPVNAILLQSLEAQSFPVWIVGGRSVSMNTPTDTHVSAVQALDYGRENYQRHLEGSGSRHQVIQKLAWGFLEFVIAEETLHRFHDFDPFLKQQREEEIQEEERIVKFGTAAVLESPLAYLQEMLSDLKNVFKEISSEDRFMLFFALTGLGSLAGVMQVAAALGVPEAKIFVESIQSAFDEKKRFINILTTLDVLGKGQSPLKDLKIDYDQISSHLSRIPNDLIRARAREFYQNQTGFSAPLGSLRNLGDQIRQLKELGGYFRKESLRFRRAGPIPRGESPGSVRSEVRSENKKGIEEFRWEGRMPHKIRKVRDVFDAGVQASPERQQRRLPQPPAPIPKNPLKDYLPWRDSPFSLAANGQSNPNTTKSDYNTNEQDWQVKTSRVQDISPDQRTQVNGHHIQRSPSDILPLALGQFHDQERKLFLNKSQIFFIKRLKSRPKVRAAEVREEKTEENRPRTIDRSIVAQQSPAGIFALRLAPTEIQTEFGPAAIGRSELRFLLSNAEQNFSGLREQMAQAVDIYLNQLEEKQARAEIRQMAAASSKAKDLLDSLNQFMQKLPAKLGDQKSNLVIALAEDEPVEAQEAFIEALQPFSAWIQPVYTSAGNEKNIKLPPKIRQSLHREEAPVLVPDLKTAKRLKEISGQERLPIVTLSGQYSGLQPSKDFLVIQHEEDGIRFAELSKEEQKLLIAEKLARAILEVIAQRNGVTFDDLLHQLGAGTDSVERFSNARIEGNRIIFSLKQLRSELRAAERIHAAA